MVQWSLIVGLGALLGGCLEGVEFEADTVVSANGEVARTSRLAISKDSPELQRYVLPAAGQWVNRPSTRKVPDLKTRALKEESFLQDVYEVAAHYAPGAPVLPDHQRKHETVDRIASNDIHLSVDDYVVVKLFHYREGFSDLATPDAFFKAIRRGHEYWLECLGSGFEQEFDGAITAGQVKLALRREFAPLVARFEAGVRHRGPAFFGASNEEDLPEELRGLEPLWGEADKLVPIALRALPRPTEAEAGSWEQKVKNACETAKRIFDAGFSGQEFSDLEPGYSGVYGLATAGAYSFRETLSLPGTILRTNAGEREGDRLVWKFSNGDFFWRDYTLSADSRLVYPGRIVLAILVALGLLAVSWRMISTRARSS